MSKARISRYRNGGVTCEIDDALAARFDAIIRKVAPTVLERFEQEIEEIEADAHKNWPVGQRTYKSGKVIAKKANKPHSRDLFQIGIEYSINGVSTFLLNEADYAYYIKSWQGNLVNQSPWQEYVRKPAFKRKRTLQADLIQELVMLRKD